MELKYILNQKMCFSRIYMAHLIAFSLMLLNATTCCASTYASNDVQIISSANTPNGAPANEALPHSIRLIHASGKSLASILVQSCSDSNWETLSPLLTTSDFFSYVFRDSYEVLPTRTGLKIQADNDKDFFTVKISQPFRIDIKTSERLYSGADACEIIASYLNEFPALNANSTTFFIAATLAGTSQFGPTHSTVDFSTTAMAIVLSSEIGRTENIQLDLNRVLDPNYVVRCNELQTTIQTPLHKIVIHRKGKSKPTIDYFNKDTDIALNIDKQSVFASQAGEYLATLTKNCKKTKDAEVILREATDAQEDAQHKISSLLTKPTRLPSSNSKR